MSSRLWPLTSQPYAQALIINFGNLRPEPSFQRWVRWALRLAEARRQKIWLGIKAQIFGEAPRPRGAESRLTAHWPLFWHFRPKRETLEISWNRPFGNFRPKEGQKLFQNWWFLAGKRDDFLHFLRQKTLGNGRTRGHESWILCF